MSTVSWRGNRLVQRINSIGAEQDLGIVTEEADGTAILWLRAAEFTSMADAKQNAAGSAPASDAHAKWVAAQSGVHLERVDKPEDAPVGGGPATVGILRGRPRGGASILIIPEDKSAPIILEIDGLGNVKSVPVHAA